MTSTESSILVVDDNKDNLRVVSHFLRDEGYRIALSYNTDHAYQILHEQEIHLILLDVVMPVENGYAFCHRIMQEDHLKEIPVIFLTALNDIDHLVEGFKVGGVDYITKPFVREELLARVRNHVDLSNAKKNIQRQAEEIRQVNHTRDRMYSVISHDIKSPLANLTMMISMIAEGYLDPQSEEFREVIHSLSLNTKETYNLLENLLQWTCTQTGRINLQPEVVTLQALVDESLSVVNLQASHKGIFISTEIRGENRVYVDPIMVRSIIRNLLSNAIKYTETGGRIEITGHTEADRVLLQIRDTGIGMTEAQLAALFTEENIQTTPGTRNEKGSGLGLHLVKEFTLHNHGEITATSKPGEGSTFYLYFPKHQ
jgi:two-component system, sensor histidine kinase and response regulator